ncbi:MAG: uroporphyrinogen decarboxylase family protein [Candidatus Methanospirareceae archaeon]
MEMTPKERMEAVIRGEEPDRVPVSFFSTSHIARLIKATIPEMIKDAEKIARGSVAFFEKYGVDSVLVALQLHMIEEAYGCKIRYYDSTDDMPFCERGCIEEPEGYEKLEVLDPRRDGRIPIYLKAVREVSKKVGRIAPVSVGIMHPLGTLLDMRGREAGLADIILNPDLMHKGLEVVSETEIEFLKACIEEGADSILFAPGGYGGVLSPKQALEFGIRYDVKVLKELHKMKIPITAHFCGPKPYIDLCLREYPPIQVLSWWDRGANLSLKEAKEKYGRKIVLSAGIDQTRTLLFGSPRDVEEEAKDAIRTAARGGRFILSPGCEVAPQTPEENIFAMIEAAKKYGKYPLRL